MPTTPPLFLDIADFRKIFPRKSERYCRRLYSLICDTYGYEPVKKCQLIPFSKFCEYMQADETRVALMLLAKP